MSAEEADVSISLNLNREWRPGDRHMSLQSLRQQNENEEGFDS